MAKGKNKGKKKAKAAAEAAAAKEAKAQKLAEPLFPDGVTPDDETLYDLADLFKVFADTTRIKILIALMAEDRCVAEIADAVGVTQSAISHQLRSMKQAHLVKYRREGKQIIYSLSDDHVYAMLSQGLTHICE